MNTLLLILDLLLLAAVVVLCYHIGFGRAAIDMRAPVGNTARKFGEAQAYFSGKVIDASGHAQTALFTAAQLQEALLRGLRNPEDL